LQCVAVCCIVLQNIAVCCSVLQCVAVCCSVLQWVAVCCRVLQSVVLRWVAVRCSMSQRIAVCCSVFQRVAVCCSVLQCVSVTKISQRVIHVKTFSWHNLKHLNDIIILTTNLRVWRECFYDQKKSHPLILCDSFWRHPQCTVHLKLVPIAGKTSWGYDSWMKPSLGYPLSVFNKNSTLNPVWLLSGGVRCT